MATTSRSKSDAEPSIADRVSSAVSQAKSAYEDSKSATSEAKDALEQAKSAVEQAKGKVTELGNTAKQKIDENRVAAAAGMENIAATLHQRADQLPGGSKVTDVAHTAAEKLDATAGYVRRNDFSSMLQDVEGFVQKSPGAALLIAAGLGFLLARPFTGNRG